ncbi:putative gamma-glutamylcyclotransferase CG2811 [Lycorma delicatula]|uniref:putative gamma-glutamylcyclotransferase CG2811 n=1 Tax=Lycorma delicatula TaxID=130591 RepID=UPI003F517F5B
MRRVLVLQASGYKYCQGPAEKVSSSATPLFVYGTLKRGQPNHYWLRKTENGSSDFIGTGKTTKKYPLIIATNYNIPFLLFEPGIGHIVSGEVYQVNDSMLSKLDALENHPNYYERRMEPIKIDVDEKTVDCWTYFLKEHKKELLKQPMYSSYDYRGEHGLVYCEKEFRDPNYDYRTPLFKQTS